MKKIVNSIVSFSLLVPLIGPNALALSKPVVKEDVIIMFKKKADNTLVQNSGGVIEDKYKNIPAIAANIPVSSISTLKKDPDVAYVEIDKPVKPMAQTIDWGMVNTKSIEAKTSGFTGKGVKVAVLDTGVKTNHPDLLLGGGYNPISTNFDDFHGHGTHVAGIIGAKDNDFGVVGVAPDSEVYGVKVLNNADGSGSTSDIIKGIDWSISNHMDIINMSLGSNSSSQAFQDAVNRAHNAGIFVVAAAGNDGNATGIGDTVDYPAKYDNVIAIGATDESNRKASFSSAGPAVDFVTPGYNILSTYKDGSYVRMSGTSMASPYFSGILALYKEAYPTYSNDQILSLMQINAVDLGDAGKDNLFGYGLAQSPLEGDSSLPTAPVPNAPLHFSTTEVLANSVSLKWDADTNAKLYDLKRNGILVYSGKSTIFTDKVLAANTTYQYELVAKNISGKSPAASLSVKTKSISLTTPYLRSVKTLTGYNLTWSKVTGATNYRLFRNGSLIYSGSSLSYTEPFANLSSGTNYTYTLTAESETAVSRDARVTFTTAPDAVTGLREVHNSTTATLTWNPVNGATFYQVKLNGKLLYKGNATQYIYKGLLSGLSYPFTVEAGNIGGTSAPASVSFSTPQTVPTAPLTVSATGTMNSATLKWTAIYNASSYRIYKNGVLLATTTTTTFTDTNLTPGTTYTYSVSAGNEVGESLQKTISFTTIPLGPTSFDAVPTPNSVSLKWNSVQGATYYLVKRNGVIVYKGANLSYINTMLRNNTAYTYTLQVGNTAGLNPTILTLSTKTLPPITTKLSINTNASYQAGQTVLINTTLQDVSNQFIPNETVSVKVIFPNNTSRTYNLKTDYNGAVNLIMYTNYYTLKGNYTVQVTKSYVATGVYSGATASKTFTLY